VLVVEREVADPADAQHRTKTALCEIDAHRKLCAGLGAHPIGGLVVHEEVDAICSMFLESLLRELEEVGPGKGGEVDVWEMPRSQPVLTRAV